MQKWYLIKGNDETEVCLLSQKWGSFVHPTDRTITYPASKAGLCEEDDKFSLVHPTVVDFDDGIYKITSHANPTAYNLMNSVNDVVRASEGTGLWEILGDAGITFTFRSISTNEQLEVLSNQLETGNHPHQWHIVPKDNNYYCIQDISTTKYITVTNA